MHQKQAGFEFLPSGQKKIRLFKKFPEIENMLNGHGNSKMSYFSTQDC